MEIEEKESWAIGLIYIFNFVFGTGLLGYPWAFFKAGYVYSSIIQLITTMLAIILSYLTIQAWSRLTIISDIINQGHTITVVPLKDIFSSNQKNYIITSKEMNSESDDESKPLTFNANNNYYLMLKTTMGDFYANIFLLLMAFNRTLLLAAYSSIFSTSMASNIPLFGLETCNIYDYSGFFNDCKYKYWAYTVLFFAVMLPTCFFRLKQQKWMQIATFICRFILIALIVVTCIVAISTNTELEGNGENDADPEKFDFYYTGTAISIILHGHLYQSYLTTMTEFVDSRKKSLIYINNLSNMIGIITLILLGVITSFAIEDVEKLITLNWRDYSAGYDLDDKPWWCYFLSFAVILLPFAMIFSVFPIILANLSDTVASYSYQYDDLYVKNYVIFI